jgi:hypothetical protein
MSASERAATTSVFAQSDRPFEARPVPPDESDERQRESGNPPLSAIFLSGK